MSVRTLRRAAERKARKAERKLDPLNAPSVQTEPVLAVHREPVVDAQAEPKPDQTEDITATLELQDILETPPTEPPKTRPTTDAQIHANRENAKLSTGATSPTGKATVSQNRRSHGLAGKFMLLTTENPEDLQLLANSVYEEYQPGSDTEQRLVDSVIQHYWLMQRAILLQQILMAKASDPTGVDSKRLTLFLRYQSTHERSYYKAQRELRNLNKQKQKDEIGFESQTRKQEAHEARVRLTHANAQRMEIDTACRQVMEAPLPGNTRLSFEEITKACSNAIANVVYRKHSAATE